MSKKYLVTQDQTVDGMPLEDDAVIHYATCSTAAATAAKTAALSGFKLVTGAWAAIKFTVTNTAANPTLNINGTGAKAVRYRNAAVNYGALAADRIYLMVYDGTYWQIVGDLDTTYTHPTSAGNKHIPTGGESNQILTYSASGTAKWSGICNAEAIDVVTGSKADTSIITIPYKEGRTKALIIGYPNKATTGYAAYYMALVTGISNDMITEKRGNSTEVFEYQAVTYKVATNGDITIAGYIGSYCVIWFN